VTELTDWKWLKECSLGRGKADRKKRQVSRIISWTPIHCTFPAYHIAF